MINEIGNRYKYLTVLSYVNSMNDNGYALWKCKCDCGNIIIVRGHSLRTGHTKSCGCWKRESFIKRIQLPEGISSFNNALWSMKINARNRKIVWQLSDEQAKKLMDSKCYYCNSEPSNISKEKNRNGSYRYNGIDRVDNHKGYILDNVVSCCKICNRAKSTMSIDEFEDWIKKLISAYGTENIAKGNKILIKECA